MEYPIIYALERFQQRMAKASLLHIKIDEEIREDMEKLVKMGMFSTDAELAREAIRNLLVDIRDRG